MKYFLSSLSILIVLTGCGEERVEKSIHDKPSSSILTEENYIKVVQFQLQQRMLQTPINQQDTQLLKTPYNPSGAVDTSGTNTLQVDTVYDNNRKIKMLAIANANRKLKALFSPTDDNITITLFEENKPIAERRLSLSELTQTDSDAHYIDQGDE